MSLHNTNHSSDYNSGSGGSLGSELNHHHNSNYARKMAFLSESNVKRLDSASNPKQLELDEDDNNGGFRRRSSESDSIMSTSINDTTMTGGTLTQTIITVPTGLKVVALVSMITAITLIVASGLLLYKSNQTLVAWLKAAPTTLMLLGQVNKIFGGTNQIVQEVESQEKYLRLLIICSATLIAAGIIQLACNIWFFFRMNSSCVARCLTKTDQFCCGY